MSTTPPDDLVELLSELLLQVRAGSLSPVEADRMATELGAPLSFRPDPSVFFHLREKDLDRTWRVASAVAWVITRRAEAMTEMSAEFRRACQEWYPLPSGGFDLRAPDPEASFGDLARALPEWRSRYPRTFLTARNPIVEAQRLIGAAARAGRLEARGLPVGSSDRRAILAAKWDDLEWFGGSPALVAVGVDGARRDAYRDVSFRPEQVRELFAAMAVAPRDDMETELKDLFIDEEKKSIQGQMGSFGRAIEIFNERHQTNLTDKNRVVRGAKEAFKAAYPTALLSRPGRPTKSHQ